MFYSIFFTFDFCLSSLFNVFKMFRLMFSNVQFTVFKCSVYCFQMFSLLFSNVQLTVFNFILMCLC